MVVITDECINCSACMDECDSNAIYDAGQEYVIDGTSFPAVSDNQTYIAPELCNECKSCIEVCAVEAIVEQ
ncbi:MAG: 4Fe-4S binding protein [Bacteroidetes bacterium]|nr:4Fe-4S binding protein [Bacteroidota bacterium]MBU2507064.1 4Fe-4S binding protein [Bacteroidota bacterium]